MGKHDNTWRHRQHTNAAKLRYTPEVLRSHYVEAQCPLMPSYPDLVELIAPVALPLILLAGEVFNHSLGTEINSRSKPVPRERKADSAVPEWYSEPAEAKPPSEEAKLVEADVLIAEEAKPKEKVQVEVTKTAKNLQPLVEEEGKYSRIDELLEIKLKQRAQEPEEPVPEWDEPGPVEEPRVLQKYHSDVIKKQLSEGNPFCSTLLDGVTMDQDSFICPSASSKAYEKVWFYKDPQGEVQGPFDSVEMFNWYAAGYFHEDLQVSYTSKLQFMALSYFIEQQQLLMTSLTAQPESAKLPVKQVAQATTKQSAWGSRQSAPVASLADIQRQQAKQ
jgi:PERQ amino acid-rich with GYF domain-containing protein